MPHPSPVNVEVASRMQERRVLWTLLAVVLAVSVYRIGSRELLGLGLDYEEAQYWAWSLDPAFGYFSKPPMIAWAIGLARAACGDGMTCIRLPAPIALGAATLVVYALGRDLFDVRTGAVAALLFFFAPLTAFLSWFVTTDSLLLLAWAVALLCFVRAVDTDRMHWWVATGVAAGLGLMSKYTMGIFAVSALGFMLSAAPQRALLRRPGPYIGAIVAAVLFAPNIAWNLTHQFATFGHTAELSKLDAPGLHPLHALRFLGEQFGMFGPLAMGAFVIAAARGVENRSDSPIRARRHALLVWFVLPFLLIITAQAFAARAYANWAAPAYVGASVLAGAWLAKPARRRWLIATVAVNIVLMLGFYHYRQILPAVGVELPPGADPLQKLEGWEGLGHAVALQLDATGARLLTDDRRTMSWLMYYAGPSSEGRAGGDGERRARDALTWNPERRIDNHYRLMRDVERAPRGPFLLVSALDRSDLLAQQFAVVEPLGTLYSGPCKGCERKLFAYRLGDFRGYTTRVSGVDPAPAARPATVVR